MKTLLDKYQDEIFRECIVLRLTSPVHATMNVGHSKPRAADNMDNFQRFLSNDEIKMSSERSSASKKVNQRPYFNY